MGSLDPNMCMTAFTLKKDFKKCHLQYSYQGIHMLNFMQSITKELSAGFSAAYIVSTPIFLRFYSPCTTELSSLMEAGSTTLKTLSCLSTTPCTRKKSSCLESLADLAVVWTYSPNSRSRPTINQTWWLDAEQNSRKAWSPALSQPQERQPLCTENSLTNSKLPSPAAWTFPSPNSQLRLVSPSVLVAVCEQFMNKNGVERIKETW